MTTSQYRMTTAKVTNPSPSFSRISKTSSGGLFNDSSLSTTVLFAKVLVKRGQRERERERLLVEAKVGDYGSKRTSTVLAHRNRYRTSWGVETANIITEEAFRKKRKFPQTSAPVDKCYGIAYPRPIILTTSNTSSRLLASSASFSLRIDSDITDSTISDS